MRTTLPALLVLLIAAPALAAPRTAVELIPVPTAEGWRFKRAHTIVGGTHTGVERVGPDRVAYVKDGTRFQGRVPPSWIGVGRTRDGAPWYQLQVPPLEHVVLWNDALHQLDDPRLPAIGAALDALRRADPRARPLLVMMAEVEGGRVVWAGRVELLRVDPRPRVLQVFRASTGARVDGEAELLLQSPQGLTPRVVLRPGTRVEYDPYDIGDPLSVRVAGPEGSWLIGAVRRSLVVRTGDDHHVKEQRSPPPAAFGAEEGVSGRAWVVARDRAEAVDARGAVAFALRAGTPVQEVGTKGPWTLVAVLGDTGGRLMGLVRTSDLAAPPTTAGGSLLGGLAPLRR